ncbi:hypothetical protein [Photorhabdus sp. SF281]|uniref:hypothetical protein n=1 Tax=Photorhabdus sp. SF281 TaxID=3459527 RepID=UPI004044BF86
MATKKSKSNHRKLLQKKNIASPVRKEEYTFNGILLPTDISLVDFCLSILEQVRINPTLESSSDFHFARMIIYWENKDYEMHRESAFLLLLTIGDEIPSYINKLISGKHSFTLSERMIFLNLDNIRSELKTAHHYYQLFDVFIRVGAKGRVSPYFNCFMRLMDNVGGINCLLSEHLYDDVLLTFYEYFHRLLIDNGSELNKFTLFVDNHLYGEGSQSVYFFLSYFKLNEKDKQAIGYASAFLSARNLSYNSSYKKLLCKNTISATIRCSLWHEYDEWMMLLESLVGYDDPVYQQLQEQGEKAINKELERYEHPINPVNITPVALDSVSTEMLLILAGFIDGCGGDWGFTTTEQRLRYTFPSTKISNRLLKDLLTKHIIKISASDFNVLEDDELYNFDLFINNSRLHLNIIGIEDTKTLSLKIIKEEILRRNDVECSLVNVWREITIGYFYSTLEYYLLKASGKWAQDFSLNENTMQRLVNIHSSARRLSFVAFSSVNSTAGFHELQSSGTRHTQNMLLHKINRYLDFIEKNDADYSKPRFDKAPVLSIERIINELFHLDPITLYNEVPSIDIVKY